MELIWVSATTYEVLNFLCEGNVNSKVKTSTIIDMIFIKCIGSDVKEGRKERYQICLKSYLFLKIKALHTQLRKI